ncbi:hypothetical protein VHEMI03650 [[Torrubiella] hemipterigena]|uniref:YhhN-like protein n=1 Tax=[Torrubiella] hemipterigena TaxID=1531966 RepID=A0A0A1TBZ4_9HYPO|nr:hypothetical protein VHEMI03650 [[Torrubiella] hemipterigena]
MPTIDVSLDSTDGAALIASLTLSFLYLINVRAAPSATRMVFKTASTTLLGLFAYLRGGNTLIIPALLLGSLGDAFLAWPGDEAFLKGLSSFLVAHLFYIGLFVRAGGGLEQIWAEPWRQGLAGFMLLLAPVQSSILMPRVNPKLQVPILAYSSTILVMVLSVLTVDDSIIVGGATLFALSDAILSTDEFVLPKDSALRSPMQHAVWILYYSGQLLIALGYTSAQA